jgi:hypothetical protein
MMNRLFFAFAVFAIIIGSCYYDSEESLYPVIGNTCDTTNVTFTNSIVPLLQNNCLTCHSNNNAASQGGNIRLQNYADINSNKTNFLASINHSPGHSPMPKGSAQLKSCFIQQVEIWINKGAPNN